MYDLNLRTSSDFHEAHAASSKSVLQRHCVGPPPTLGHAAVAECLRERGGWECSTSKPPSFPRNDIPGVAHLPGRLVVSGLCCAAVGGDLVNLEGG